MSFGSFGSSNSNPFGSSSGGFGSGGGFGQTQQQNSGFGSTSGGFGSSNNTFGSSGGFGSTTQNSFGSSFGQQQPQQQQTGGFGGSGQGSAGFGQVPNPNGDYEIPRDANSAQDSISSLKFSPMEGSNLLIVGSWDSKVRCYEVQDNGSMLKADLRAFIAHEAPVLDVCFKDGSGCFSCGCDNVVRAWQFEANPGQQNSNVVGKHDAPIKACHWIPERSLLATGGWDGKLLYWDLRTQNPVLQCQMPNNARIDCMDISFPYCVVGTGGTENDRQVLVYNLNNPAQPELVLNHTNASSTSDPTAKPLKKQYRTVSIFPDKTGFAIASIEGRCSIGYFNKQRCSDTFAFKCHRDRDKKRIYSVNNLTFHKQFGTFASAGSDGIWNFWDKDSKQRLKVSATINLPNNEPAPITCAAFNAVGNLYAYGISYDWSKGAAGNPQQNISSVMIHRVQEGEIKPKKGAPLRR